MPPGPTLRLAHRGDGRYHPENTLPALLAALEAGCDGVELDVRASRDGVPVLLHDPTLARVHRRPEAVGHLSAEELEPLGVPTLADALAVLPRRAFLDIELKEPFGRGLVEVLAAGRGPDLHNAVVSSFDPVAIGRIRDLVPGWRCWFNSRDLSAGTIATATRLGCVGVAALARAIDPRTIRAAQAAGLEVAAWTVTRRGTYARLAELGVVAICVEGEALTS